MNVYIYRAALYCADCGEAIRARLTAEGKAPADPADEVTYDSEDFPKGPYENGGGEADCAQHCDGCSAFLENPLTQDGREHVADAIREHFETGDGDARTLAQWAEHYGFSFCRYDYAGLKAEYRLDGADPWGNGMGWFFAVAAEMDRRNLLIPDEWRYRPNGHVADLAEYEPSICAAATDEALERFGALLNRYTRLIKHLGKDY